VCGIAGVFGKNDPDTIDRMLGRLGHRGPDDHFLVSGRFFTIGARRLAIIDVEGGRQPLSNETGVIWVCQNGEIYNFLELRSELESRGHRFQSRSDTEVLPHLYEEHGSKFPTRLRGMFAVALWDDEKRQGILARDHTGKKPLYYLDDGKALYFASEIKGLLAIPGYDRRIHAPAIHHFLSYKHVPAPDTAFSGIKELAPAHVLTWSTSGQSRERYWRPCWGPSRRWERMGEEEIADQLLAKLKEAVELRLLSDVPIGFYLSGGIDSSLSTAIAATLSPTRILTFTLAYDESSTTPGKESDRAWARAVAERYGTDHHEEVLRIGNFAEAFRDILYHFDQPFSGVVSSYFLSRLIGRHVKVALSGDGADELFGSYLSHRLAPAIAAFLAAGGPDRLPEDLLPLFRDHQEMVTRIADPDPVRWRSRLFVFSEEEKLALYTPEFRAQVEEASSERLLADYFSEPTAGDDPLNRVLEAEFRGIFPDQVLAFVDRLSMAHSLETRTAYLDREFVELAASIPGRLKIKGRACKYILKQAARRFLPGDLIDRQKEGFVMPVNDWLANGLREFTDQVLAPSRVARAGILKPEAVRETLSRFRAGERRLANQVLSLLALQVWWEDYWGPERRL
jgi:asparagine synthase (glutamine-hydrolysing)